MENSGGIQASLAGRYARALFDLAVERGSLDSVAKSLADFEAQVAASDDLRGVLTNPLVARKAATQAVAAVARTLKLDALTTNFLGVLADNVRLRHLPAIAEMFAALVAAHRGEVTALVTSAHPLSSAQIDALKSKLQARVGSDVVISTTVDPQILGGLIVKIGSQMIDGSIATKLNSLSLAMKG